MSWPTLTAVRTWTAKRRFSLRGLVGATVETVASCVPCVSVASKVLGELAAHGVDRLAGVDEVPGLKPGGAPLSLDQLEQLNAWLESVTNRYAELLDRLESRLPATSADPSAEELTVLVRQCIAGDGELTRRFDEHLVEARRQTLSLGMIERQLDEFAHGHRQMWASLEEIKDLFASMPGMAEWTQLRTARPDALKAVQLADEHFLAGRRDQAIQALFDLLRLRGVGEATLARHVTPRLCGLIELTPAVRAKLRLEPGSPAARTMTAVTTWHARGMGLKVWRSLPRGTVIERKYRIEEEVGRGGMASVYRAVGVGMLTKNKVYAIKVPAAELLEDGDTAERFIREVDIAQQFSSSAYNAHVVQTLGHVAFDDPHVAGRELVGLVLEYIEGQSLARLLEARKLAGKELSPEEIHYVLDKLCLALEHAHGHGVLHRDVKPPNVLLGGKPGTPILGRTVKLMDFGIARVLDEGLDDLTRGGVVLGTRGYLPPEFTCDPPRASVRSDVYLVGVLMREMLTFHPKGDLETLADCPEAWMRLIDEATREVERYRPASIAVVRQRLAEGLREWQALRDGRESELREERARSAMGRFAYAEAVAELERVDENKRDAGLYAQAVGKRDRLVAIEKRVQEVGGEARLHVFHVPLVDEWKALRPDLAGLAGTLEAARTRLPKQVVNSIGMKFALIPAGKFVMGSPNNEAGRRDNEGPQHEVTISRPLWMGVFPVTVGQFRAFVQAKNYKTEAEKSNGAYGWTGSKWEQSTRFNWSNPGFMQADDHPVTCVTWNDAIEFLAWLNELKEEKECGRTFRLPTEAEWEYSCRGGASSYQTYHVGNSLTEQHANFNQKNGGTTPAGRYPANGYGLLDMHGNVWEWCSDWYEADYYKKSPPVAPPGPPQGSYRADRGGGWGPDASGCRSALRANNSPDHRGSYLGFRVAVGPSGT